MILQDKIAIVTGAGGGIGSGVAELMAKQGASVVVNDAGSNLDGSGTSRKSADLVVDKINKAGGVSIANYESIDNFNSCARIIQSALDEFGKIDIICHTAGILRDRMIFNMNEDEWDRVLEVHLKGLVMFLIFLSLTKPLSLLVKSLERVNHIMDVQTYQALVLVLRTALQT